MSLHNSTVIENLRRTTMNSWPETFKWTRERSVGSVKGGRKPFFTNSKPSEAGLNLGGGTAERSGVFGRSESEGRKRNRADADSDEGQANKSARGMPWHQEPMKDVISCEKLRGAANELRAGDIRMGKPTVRYPILNKIGIGGEPPELKHLSRARKRHQPRFRK